MIEKLKNLLMPFIYASLRNPLRHPDRVPLPLGGTIFTPAVQQSPLFPINEIGLKSGQRVFFSIYTRIEKMSLRR
jgi:hypothetical protein